MTSTMLLGEGYDKPDAIVLRFQKANGRGVLGDTTNLRFYASAKCVANHGSGSKGDKDFSGALRSLRNQLEFLRRGSGLGHGLAYIHRSELLPNGFGLLF
jgi:hypothetical protein